MIARMFKIVRAAGCKLGARFNRITVNVQT